MWPKRGLLPSSAACREVHHRSAGCDVIWGIDNGLAILDFASQRDTHLHVALLREHPGQLPQNEVQLAKILVKAPSPLLTSIKQAFPCTRYIGYQVVVFDFTRNEAGRSFQFDLDPWCRGQHFDRTRAIEEIHLSPPAIRNLIDSMRQGSYVRHDQVVPSIARKILTFQLMPYVPPNSPRVRPLHRLHLDKCAEHHPRPTGHAVSISPKSLLNHIRIRPLPRSRPPPPPSRRTARCWRHETTGPAMPQDCPAQPHRTRLRHIRSSRAPYWCPAIGNPATITTFRSDH